MRGVQAVFCRKNYWVAIALIVSAFFMSNANAAPQFESREAFIQYMLPKIQKANTLIRYDRNKLENVYQQWRQTGKIDARTKNWVHQLAEQYKISSHQFNRKKEWEMLLDRVDTIPPSLALAQAINESNWGRSRFAKQANNFFGQWCYVRGCGIVPKNRRQGGRYEVKSFGSATDSIRGYMLNLNRNTHYEKVRMLRRKLREQDRKLSGIQLARGLTQYSERGERYVQILQMIIRENDLDRYDRQSI